MPREITDQTIKRKHAEFDKRVKAVLEEVRGQSGVEELSPAIQQLRQTVLEQKPKLLNQGQ